jgi:pimeloyl-ACP methyl ester carboxylesterase
MSLPYRSARACLLATVVVSAALGCARNPKPQTLTYGGGTLYVDDGGRGRTPVVFIHGNGGNSTQWRAQLAHLRANGQRALAIDLPGFGKSSPMPSGNYSLDSMSRAVDATVRQLGLSRFVLVGHSYGGALVAKYAASHPEKVAGVVLVDAAAVTLPLSSEQITQISAAIRANKMQIVRMMFAPILKPSTEQVQSEVFASVEHSSTDAFLGALLSLTTYDARALMSAYTGPRLAIVATDTESPMSFHKQFPEVETVRISGAGHWLMLDRPNEVNAAIDAFLRKLP